MRIAVTGASGNVGTSLLRRLNDDSSVRAVLAVARRPPDPGTGPLHDKVTWLKADVSQDDLHQHLRGCDTVVHLAWLMHPNYDTGHMRQVNVAGSRRVMEASIAAGVRAIVYASSVGAYSPGPHGRRVDETWPTGGVDTSPYSRQKSEVERLLDRVEQHHRRPRLVRMRPGIVLNPAAASEIERYFVGPFLPLSLLRREFFPVLPLPPGLAFQALHAEDMASAYHLAATREDAHGAYNAVAEPVLDRETLAALLGARLVDLPRRVARTGLDLLWRAHLQPTDPGWLDLALRLPLLDASRLREELGWTPRHDPRDTLAALLPAMRERVGDQTPVLRPLARAPQRLVRGIRRDGSATPSSAIPPSATPPAPTSTSPTSASAPRARPPI